MMPPGPTPQHRVHSGLFTMLIVDGPVLVLLTHELRVLEKCTTIPGAQACR
jgi:hypothetical protein